VDRRSRARELAMQALYQLDMQGPDAFVSLDEFFAENEPDPSIRQMASEWTRKTWENLAACDELISGSTIRWDLSRLAPVDKSILRLSVYQLKFCPDIPQRVVMNEAIELAKKFGGEKSFAFVNGVLDAVAAKLGSQQDG